MTLDLTVQETKALREALCDIADYHDDAVIVDAGEWRKEWPDEARLRIARLALLAQIAARLGQPGTEQYFKRLVIAYEESASNHEEALR